MFKGLNKGILYTTLILVFSGFFIFFSASLSNLKNEDFFISIFSKQIISIFLGLILMFWIAHSRKINSFWVRKYSGHFFLFFLLIQLLVIIPGIGIKLKGGQRWIDLGLVTIQPSEFFKYSFIIFLTAVVLTVKSKIKKLKGFLILSFLFFFPVTLFFIYIRDLGTLMAILFSSIVVFLFSEVRYRYIFIPILILGSVVAPLVYLYVPYIHDRLSVYLSPEKVDLLNEGYQWNQSLITIGSGQITGRGFGGSLQKFYGSIPEPLGDSIFAVYAEEFGFIGGTILIFSFVILLYFILKSAGGQKNIFKKTLISALGVLLVFPAFYNIGASLGILPLSGMPITFVSKGGTAILGSLMVIGLILRFTKK